MIRNRTDKEPSRRHAPVVGLFALAALAAAIIAAAVPANAAPATVSVLCYHSFLDKKRMDPYCFTIEELNSQIMQLRKEGFRFVSVNDVISGRITGSKNVLVTIDDGNRSVYEAFQKVFRPNGIRPLLGIYPNIIDKKKYALTWDQLEYLANNGCDIAAHGFFHLKINQKLQDSNPRYFHMEIFKSREVLEEKLKRRVTVFIFPFGLRTDVAVAALKEAGYRYGFTIKMGRIDLPIAAGGDRVYSLPRYMVTRTNWNVCFNRIMKNAGMSAASSVAAAEKKGPLVAVNDLPATGRIDPITRLEEHLGERPSPVSVKLTARVPDKADKQGQRKKKREERTALVSEPRTEAPHDRIAKKDEPRLLTPEKMMPVDRDGAVASPIQRVTSGVRRDTLGPDAGGGEVYEGMGPRAVALDDAGSVGERDGGETRGNDGAVLKGKVDRNARGFHADMKKGYRAIHDGSRRSYDRFLAVVREKLGRYRTRIREYVMKNF